MTVRTATAPEELASSVDVVFARILRDHGASLRRVAASYARSDSETADLAQEIAIAVWRALPGFRGDASLRTFVFRIAHNRGVSFAHARAAAKVHDPIGDDDAIVDPSPSGVEVLLGRERRTALLEAIRALPLGARSVMTLALEGLTHEEIANVLGTTPNSVAVRLNHARARVREHVRKHHGT